MCLLFLTVHFPTENKGWQWDFALALGAKDMGVSLSHPSSTVSLALGQPHTWTPVLGGGALSTKKMPSEPENRPTPHPSLRAQGRGGPGRGMSSVRRGKGCG